MYIIYYTSIRGFGEAISDDEPWLYDINDIRESECVWIVPGTVSVDD